MDMDLDHDTTQVIDPTLGLQLANFKPDLADTLLKMMVAELPEMRDTLLDAYHKKNYEDLCKEVHKLHGASCYCGVPRMKTAAMQLESNLKTRNTTEIDTLFKTLVFEVDQVLECYAKSYPS